MTLKNKSFLQSRRNEDDNSKLILYLLQEYKYNNLTTMGMIMPKNIQPSTKKVDNQWVLPLSKSFPMRKIQNPVDASTNLLKTISATCRRQIGGLNLLFRASEHKFRSQMFHQICCDKVNTIVLALTVDNQVYGGFTPCPWKHEQYITYEADEQSFSFLFSFSQEGNLQTFPIKSQNNSYAIMNDQQLGPVFGEGHDLLITDQSDKNESWNNLGKTYKCQYPFGSIKANSQLNGEQKFMLREYEVWQVVLN